MVGREFLQEHYLRAGCCPSACTLISLCDRRDFRFLQILQGFNCPISVGILPESELLLKCLSTVLLVIKQ